MKEGILFVISGPSGSGKTTLSREVMKRLGNLQFSVSYTTRKPRKGEIDGKDYHFISEDIFKEMVEGDKFAEYALVHGNYYGTPLDEIDKAKNSGTDLVLDIDVNGASQLRGRYDSGVHCFVIPSSFELLKERLTARSSDADRQIEKRLADSKREIEEMKYYDYIIINDEFETAVGNLAAVIMSARCEKQRVINSVTRNFY